ncbi:MAG TPA: 2-dehydropantoate 2-reductase N-terminal domain-containing protein, partial [Thermoanaerobaculia bacterium]|nr:2-dehydropantoate 2-reductase N-terminal domain-containing protein [Thermoanaerobaculia bacterium]
MGDRLRVLICGTGSAAHVLGAVLSAHGHVDVRVMSLNIVRANEWAEIAGAARLTVTSRDEVQFEASGLTITSDPELAARDCDIVIISVPAFLHLQYLTALAPYLPTGCLVVGLPGQNGFEFDVRKALGDRFDSTIVINFESLPWICRTDEFGRSARIHGTKARLVGAMHGDSSRARITDPVHTLQDLLGETPKLVITGHPLGITLRAPNAYSHPPI